MLMYTGVQAYPVLPEVLAPGTPAEAVALAYKLVRPSTVTAVLLGPGDAQIAIDTGERVAGVYDFPWRGLDSEGRILPEGGWTWRVSAVDDLGRRSEAERSFSLNTTLMRLAVEPQVLYPGSSARITVDLARAARLTITIERSGAVLRTLAKRAVESGTTTVSWNGRRAGGAAVPAGTYVVRAVATNQIGTAELTAPLRKARK
jgi:flagellar hook assembly protein FlgD